MEQVKFAMAEKKAIRAADENIAAQVEKFKAAAGSAELSVTVDWNAVGQMISENTDALASDSYENVWVLGHTGERTVAVLEAMSTISNDDADYKEELALITSIVVKPKAKFDDSKSEFSIDGTEITIESGHRMSRSASDFVEPVKALF